MVFTPPGFPLLRVNTLNLDITFSTLLGRYKLVDAAGYASSSSHIAPSQTSLEVLLARTHTVVTCKTDRTTAREVFNQLSNELRDVLKEKDEIKSQQAATFLLGALLHRYFRILKEYQSYYSNALFMGYMDPKNCKLFKAIREALQLPADMSGDYLARDLEVLDVTTIVNSLEVFRDNMLLKGTHDKPRYKKYPHFNADKNFEPYLQSIIDEHAQKGAPILKQFKAIDFIQSLTKNIDTEKQAFEAALDAWCTKLQTGYPDLRAVSLEAMEEHLNQHCEPGPLREKIADLLYIPLVQSRIGSIEHGDFLELMKKSHADISSYTVFGGYALLLQSKDIKEKLTFCIHQALGIEDNPEKMSTKNLLDGIKFLKHYIENNPEVDLKCHFFGGKEALNTALLQKEQELNARIQEQAIERTGYVRI